MFPGARGNRAHREDGLSGLNRRDISENSNARSADRAIGSGIFAPFGLVAAEFFSAGSGPTPTISA
jgi:hypothetical protein